MKRIVTGTVALMLVLLWPPGGWCQAEGGPTPLSKEVARLIAQGRDRLAANDPRGALKAFEAAMAKEPDNVGILYYVGNLHLQLDDVSGGLKYLKRSVELAPDNYRLHVALGQAYERYGDADNAIREYQAVVRLASGKPEATEADKHARLLQGRRYIQQGDAVRAEQTFAGLIKDYPDDDMVLSRAGVDYLLLNRLDDAQHALEAAAALTPNNGFFHAYLADVYDRKGNLPKAIQEYEQALKLLPPNARQVRPDTLRVAMLRGVQALENKAFAEAKAEFEQVLSLDRSNISARLNLAVADHGLGDDAKTEEVLKGILKDFPDDAEANLRLGAVYFEQKRFEEAARRLEAVTSKGTGNASVLRQAEAFLAKIYATEGGQRIKARLREEPISRLRGLISGDPNAYQAWLDLARTYAVQGRPAEAQGAYENVVRLKPDNGEANYALGRAYDEKGAYAQAAAAYQRAFALSSDPKQRAVIGKSLDLALGKVAFDAGDMDRAQAKFKALIDRDPKDLVAHFFLALVYEREEKLNDAVREYQEVIKLVPNHPGAHLRLGEVYEKLKREEEAIAEYRAVLSSNSPASITKLAQARLKVLLKDIGGFSYSLGYAWNYDTNLNLSANSPLPELRFDLSGNLAYRYKWEGQPVYWGISIDPLYRSYQRSDFDLFDVTVSPYWAFSWKDLDYSVAYSFNDSHSLLTGGDSSNYNTWSVDLSHNFKMHAVFPRLAADEERGAAPSNWRVGFSIRNYQSQAAPFLSAIYAALTGTLSQSLGNGWSWNGSYTLSKSDNTQQIGNDFSFWGNGVSLQLSKVLGSDWTVNGGYAYAYQHYTNPDSASLFTARREDNLQNLFVGASYLYTEKLRFFGNLAYIWNSSNLPTGFILSAQDVATAIGLQSPSLGAYHDFSASLGLAFYFN